MNGHRTEREDKMTEAKSIEVLKRRAVHLSERIRKAKKRGKDLTFDRMERAVLKRAIEVMEEYLDTELDNDERGGQSLGDQTFGPGWESDLSLTEEERDFLGRR